MIRPVVPADADQLADIYNHYIENTVITFEETPIDGVEMLRRVTEVTRGFPWIVLEEDKRILGYAYATAWRARSAYRYSAETTVYLDPESRGRGLGTKLYEDLVVRLATTDLHVLVAGITLPNEASQRLHEKLGFRPVARFEEIGFKFGKWLDVGYWELKLRK